MGALIRTKASIAWLALVALTVLSWVLGTEHRARAGGHLTAPLVILVVTVVKVRLIGMYFMDLRNAATLLRTAFDAYCVFLLCLIIAMFVWA